MRALVQIDGQNLLHLARVAWAPTPRRRSSPYEWPSYDVVKLAQALVDARPGRKLVEVRFYTGVPERAANRFWHDFWTNKLRHLANQGVHVYRGRVSAGRQEKGVDVSLAVDLVQATHEQRYDVSIIVSQDTDFGPAVRLAKTVAQAQSRQLVFESAFPSSRRVRSSRGVPGTTWLPIDKAMYDACRDLRDYRAQRH